MWPRNSGRPLVSPSSLHILSQLQPQDLLPVTQTGKPVPSSELLPIPGHLHILLHPSQLCPDVPSPEALPACTPPNLTHSS